MQTFWRSKDKEFKRKFPAGLQQDAVEFLEYLLHALSNEMAPTAPQFRELIHDFVSEDGMAAQNLAFFNQSPSLISRTCGFLLVTIHKCLNCEKVPHLICIINLLRR